MAGRFPLSRELAIEMASLMAQIDLGDRSRVSGNTCIPIDKFYPYRYRDSLSSEGLRDLQELIGSKWFALKGRSAMDCVRIYLTCARKWPLFGASMFQARLKFGDRNTAWLAVAEDSVSVLELTSMAVVSKFAYSSVITFGGCQDDFMLVVGSEDGCGGEEKMLFVMSKPKVLEITLLIADYMNALGHAIPGTPQMNTLTRNGSRRSFRPLVVASTCNNTLSTHGQPDILKSTPDHQCMTTDSKRRIHTDSTLARE